MVRSLVLLIVAMALAGAWVSGTLLSEHDGGWRLTNSPGTGFLLRLCESPSEPSARCAGVIDSRWGSFDIHLGNASILVPTSLIGLAYFIGIAIWFTVVNRVPAWSRRMWRLILLIGTAAVAGSILFMAVMLLNLGSWCPLCALAHGINVGLFMAILLLRRRSQSRSARRATGVLTDPPAVARIQRRLVFFAGTACCATAIGLWFYFDAVSTARGQWRKAFGIKQAIAALQSNREFVLREYYAQPFVEIPSRGEAAEPFDVQRNVALVFTDYDCPGCACFEGSRRELIDSVFGNRLRIDIRHAPARPRSNATDGALSPASRAAEAARLQGGDNAFDKMHRLLFQHRKDHPGRDVADLARQAGLSVDRFLADMRGDAVHEAVRQDMALADRLGVTSTPTVFLNGRRVPDLCLNSPVFWQAIAEDLAGGGLEEAAAPDATPMYLSGKVSDAPRENSMTPINVRDVPAETRAPECLRQPVRRAGLTVEELDGEAIVFDPETGDTHHLNETALFVWRQCDGLRDAEQIAQAVFEAYDITLPEAVEHVEQILDEFERWGLVVVRN